MYHGESAVCVGNESTLETIYCSVPLPLQEDVTPAINLTVLYYKTLYKTAIS